MSHCVRGKKYLWFLCKEIVEIGTKKYVLEAPAFTHSEIGTA
jgi:hypothetical protein